MSRAKGSSTAEKQIRIETHKLHLQFLLVHGARMNHMASQEPFQTRFKRLVPENIKTILESYSHEHDKTSIALRVIIKETIVWFNKAFKCIHPGLRKIGYLDFSNDISAIEQSESKDKSDMSGSRDYGAIIFTAILRSFGLQVRLVYSLQPLGFGFGKQEDADQDISNGKHPTEADLDKGEDLPDSDLKTPYFWSEVWDDEKELWLAADAVVLKKMADEAKEYNKFEPKGKLAMQTKAIMAYVVAYDADGYAKDVTNRYTRTAAAAKYRLKPEVLQYGTKQYEYDFFKRVMATFKRDNKDAHELAEDAALAPIEAPARAFDMNSISDYKNHPDLMLARHLKREEALKPTAEVVYTFTSGKGSSATTEKAYRRTDVMIGRTTENWFKEGKVPKPNQTPIKRVKVRAMTLARKREIEAISADNNNEPVTEGLYARHQVENYQPAPVVNGIIPKNAYNNVDLFTDNMLPNGAAHLPYRGMVKVAKSLDIDYAEAVTGFEFRKQRAIPVISGIVVAKEHAQSVLEKWERDEGERQRKADERKLHVVFTRWKKFLKGLRIREKLHRDFQLHPL